LNVAWHFPHVNAGSSIFKQRSLKSASECPAFSWIYMHWRMFCKKFGSQI